MKAAMDCRKGNGFAGAADGTPWSSASSPGQRRWRLYSRKPDPRTGRRRNLGTFGSREAAVKHEREVQFFKRR
jgi:hypothetical protein